MVDVNRLRSRMVLMGYTQKSLVAEMNARGVKTTENTFSSKMNGKSQFDCDDADVICDILEVEEPAEMGWKEVNMAREFLSDEMVDEEILRLQSSYHVKLARREEAIRNRKRNYMYQLRMYEKKGKALEAQGVTLEELEEFAGALYECE